jgi:hypothetical protein
MTVGARLSVTCDECGVKVSLPARDPSDGSRPTEFVMKVVTIRWWVQRWGWTVTEDDRDLCPDHSPPTVT